MRSACLAWLLLVLMVFLVGCGTVVERTPFRPTDDLVTTTPRTLVEAGHSTVVSPPAGVRFTLQLEIVRETPDEDMPAQHYELAMTVTSEGDIPWEADVHGVELVDDEGSTLSPPSKILRRQPTSTAGTTTSHLLIFYLPLSYQPRRIGRVTVHWMLVAAKHPPIRISSRFRR